MASFLGGLLSAFNDNPRCFAVLNHLSRPTETYVLTTPTFRSGGLRASFCYFYLTNTMMKTRKGHGIPLGYYCLPMAVRWIALLFRASSLTRRFSAIGPFSSRRTANVTRQISGCN